MRSDGKESRSWDDSDWLTHSVAPRVRGALRKAGAEKDEVDDFVQETFVRVCAARPRRPPLIAFFVRTAINLLIDKRRKQRQERLRREAQTPRERNPIPLVHDPRVSPTHLYVRLPTELLRLVPVLRWTGAERTAVQENFAGIPVIGAAREQRWQRLKKKALLRYFVYLLMNGEIKSAGSSKSSSTVTDTFHALRRVSDNLSGGLLDKFLKCAPRIRAHPTFGLRLETGIVQLLDASRDMLRRYVAQPMDAQRFTFAYLGLRTAVLLCPDFVRRNYAVLFAEFRPHAERIPLVKRLLWRIRALSGDPEAAMAQKAYWPWCLTNATNVEGSFGGHYYAGYVARRRLGFRIYEGLARGDEPYVRRIVTGAAPYLRKRFIIESARNSRERHYTTPCWASENIFRFHLGVMTVGGYHHLSPPLARKVIRVAKHARRYSQDPDAERLANSLIGTMCRVSGVSLQNL